MPSPLIRFLVTACTLVLLVPLFLVHAQARADAWRVRASGEGPRRLVDSYSDINAGKPRRRSAGELIEITRRTRGPVALRIAKERSLASAFEQANFAREVDKAVAWLARMRPGAHVPARIELAFVADTHAVREHRRHRGEVAVVDLFVPLRVGDGALVSTQIARALGIALHETSHALVATRTSRQADEYRATLVESCYTLDVLRPGDILHLHPGNGARAGESFVDAHSRDAARSVANDLIHIAGSKRIAWHDRPTIDRLRGFCDARVRAPMAHATQRRLPR